MFILLLPAQFALDEGLASNLARLEDLDKEADAVGDKLRDMSEEVVDSRVESSEEADLEQLQRQLEEITVRFRFGMIMFDLIQCELS